MVSSESTKDYKRDARESTCGDYIRRQELLEYSTDHLWLSLSMVHVMIMSHANGSVSHPLMSIRLLHLKWW